jgi:hypothetical protein
MTLGRAVIQQNTHPCYTQADARVTSVSPMFFTHTAFPAQRASRRWSLRGHFWTMPLGEKRQPRSLPERERIVPMEESRPLSPYTARSTEPTPASQHSYMMANSQDQELEGFDLLDRDHKMNATEDHTMLERLTDQLGDIYGERPIVLFWVRAEARCPDYSV